MTSIRSPRSGLDARNAGIVGATRQWVTSMLARFQARGILRVERGAIIIERADLLQHLEA